MLYCFGWHRHADPAAPPSSHQSGRFGVKRANRLATLAVDALGGPVHVLSTADEYEC